VSQFGSPSPGSFNQRAGSRGVNTGGVGDSVQVVPVPVLPANTGNLVTLEQLDRILSITGSAIGAVNQTIAAKTSKINRNNAEVEMMDRALANRHARMDAATIGQQIDEGKIKVPDGVPIDQFAQQLVNDEIASVEGAGDSYREEYKDLAPVLTEKFAAKQRADRRQANADNLDLMTDRAFAAKTPAEVAEAVAFSTKNFGVTERQAQASIVIPAMRQAAQIGDTAKVDMLASSLPKGTFAGDIDQLKLAAVATQNHQQTQRWQRGEDVLQSLLDANASTTAVRDAADELHSLGELAPGKAEQWRRTMDMRDAQGQSVAKAAMIDTIATKRLQGASRKDLEKDVAKLAEIDPSAALAAESAIQEAEAKFERERVQQEKVLFKQGVIAEGVAAAGSGLLGSARDVKALASDGKTELSVSVDEIKQGALDAAFAQIDREETAKAGNYAAAFPAAQARKVRLVGQNGVLPESFRQTLSAGSIAANPQILLEGTPPPATVAAYSLYRQMLADAPAVAERAAEGKAKELFDNAVVLQSDFRNKDGSDDVAGALAAAARNVYADPMEKAGAMDRLKAADVQAAAKATVGRSFGQAFTNTLSLGFVGRGRNDVKNIGEVEAAIRTRAAAYMPTKSPEEAIKIASARVAQQGQVVDGWWVRLPGDVSERTRSGLSEVVGAKADEWLTKNTNSGVDRGSIRATMEPSGRFVLIDNSTGLPLSPPVIFQPHEVDAAFSEARRKSANATSQAESARRTDAAKVQKIIDSGKPLKGPITGGSE